jgi:multicomponent Na+:H+ antiporter subunit E
MVLLLVVFWLLAWGDFSVVNVVSGAVLAGLLLVAFPRTSFAIPRVRLKISGLIRLVVHILRQLVISSALVARVVMSRRSRVRTGVLAYPMRDASPTVMSTLANAIALTPGTMTVEATTDPPVLYVHFLLLDDIEHARRGIAHLESLVIEALGRSSTSLTAGDGS